MKEVMGEQGRLGWETTQGYTKGRITVLVMWWQVVAQQFSALKTTNMVAERKCAKHKGRCHCCVPKLPR